MVEQIPANRATKMQLSTSPTQNTRAHPLIYCYWLVIDFTQCRNTINPKSHNLIFFLILNNNLIYVRKTQAIVKSVQLLRRRSKVISIS